MKKKTKYQKIDRNTKNSTIFVFQDKIQCYNVSTVLLKR